MGKMKEHFQQVEEHLQRGEFSQVLDKLKPWGDDAPQQLWAVLEAVSGSSERLVSSYLPTEISKATLAATAFSEISKRLERDGITALNLALALDLLTQYSNND
jgi:hypothetical protein